MLHDKNYFTKLTGLATFLEEQTNLDESLTDVLVRAANLLSIETCSIMLFKEEQRSGTFSLRIFAKHGDLPSQAFREAVKVNDGIAGHVAATGEALLVRDIAESPFFPQARRPQDPQKSFISVPIVINRKVIGVINISNPKDGRCFDTDDLNLATFVALLTGKSIQVMQLQNLLKSRYVQLAVASESKTAARDAIDSIGQEPGKMAKILAKSFYREMANLGFGSDHIVAAATEIISQLNANLARHRQRMERV